MTNKSNASSERSWQQATALAFTALLCGVLLGGVSAWFLGSVAIAGLSAATAIIFNFHAPAALVRLFAIGRTAARYGERLVGHKAALCDQVAHRVHLFASMAAAPSVRRAGWQLGDQSRLADYLDDVEDIDYARLRAGLPAITLAFGLTGCAVATAFVAPLALVPIVLSVLTILVVARRTAIGGAKAWALVRFMRRAGAQQLGAGMVSAVPLKAENGFDAEMNAALRSFRAADAATLSLRKLQSGVDMLGASFGPVACLSVIGVAWLAGGRGEMLLIPVFVAFAWLALGEPMSGLSRLVVADLRRRSAETAIIDQHSEEVDEVAERMDSPLQIAELSKLALQRRGPDGRPIGKPIQFTAQTGRPTLLTGVSGSGKTSLLKQIAGWVSDDVLSSGRGWLSPAARRNACALCLHDAAIMDDTVRANLFPAKNSDALQWKALRAVEMDDRIRQAGGLDSWIRQDELSLGEAQRLNLARAWLSARSVVLLDEPAEHLDHEQGPRILARLLDHLQDRIVVFSSHSETTPPGVFRIELRP